MIKWIFHFLHFYQGCKCSKLKNVFYSAFFCQIARAAAEPLHKNEVSECGVPIHVPTLPTLPPALHPVWNKQSQAVPSTQLQQNQHQSTYKVQVPNIKRGCARTCGRHRLINYQQYCLRLVTSHTNHRKLQVMQALTIKLLLDTPMHDIMWRNSICLSLKNNKEITNSPF